jgi:hypothetical protein
MIPELTEKDVRRFYTFILRKPETCWIWQGWKFPQGYGQFRLQGKTFRAHRVAYLITNGPFDQTLHVLHNCDNPPCVNPDHLFLGTQFDNVHDSVKKDRRAHLHGETNPYCILTDLEVNEIRDLYASQQFSQRKLAKQYNVGQAQISRIVTHKSR